MTKQATAESVSNFPVTARYPKDGNATTCATVSLHRAVCPLSIQMPSPDIDYAFVLEKKEKNGLSDESLSGGKTSAAVYQSLILEQVFKGMKERASGFISGKFSPCFCPILP